MNKILPAILFLFITTAAFSQDGEKTITYGLSGGTNFASLSVTAGPSAQPYVNMESPFSLGFNADFKFNDYFSIRPAIFYAGKGGNIQAQTSNGTISYSVYDIYHLYYLEVPVDLIGHLPFNSGANIFLGGGPFFSYGLNGSNTQTTFDVTEKKSVKFGSNGDFKSTDVGLTSTIGFQAAKGWSISANLEYGFSNILQNNTTGFDATKIKTVTFYFAVGQSF